MTWQMSSHSLFVFLNISVFPKLYKVGNAANKGLHREEQNKFSQKIAPQWG